MTSNTMPTMTQKPGMVVESGQLLLDLHVHGKGYDSLLRSVSTPQFDSSLLFHELSHFLAMPSLLEPPHMPGPLGAFSERAGTAVDEYRQFYAALADDYAQALVQAGRSADKKLNFARGEGAQRLVALSNQVAVETAEQLAQLRKVLTGYRQIAASTSDVRGRGSLLIKLVEDLARRLTRLQLIREQPQAQALALGEISGSVSTGSQPLAA